MKSSAFHTQAAPWYFRRLLLEACRAGSLSKVSKVLRKLNGLTSAADLLQALLAAIAAGSLEVCEKLISETSPHCFSVDAVESLCLQSASYDQSCILEALLAIPAIAEHASRFQPAFYEQLFSKALFAEKVIFATWLLKGPLQQPLSLSAQRHLFMVSTQQRLTTALQFILATEDLRVGLSDKCILEAAHSAARGRHWKILNQLLYAAPVIDDILDTELISASKMARSVSFELLDSIAAIAYGLELRRDLDPYLQLEAAARQPSQKLLAVLQRFAVTPWSQRPYYLSPACRALAEAGLVSSLEDLRQSLYTRNTAADRRRL